MSQPAMTPAEFEAALRAKGDYYHIHHPFHRAMYEGRSTRAQIQGWVANRFYYQVCIPVKDAAIMANCPDRETRREWIQRIIDHDGRPGEEGGIEAWLRLAESVGLAREQVLSPELVLPGPEERDFTLLLAHNPDTAERARRGYDAVDLVVSGHTHGGQVRLPGVGAVERKSEYFDAGLQRTPWTQVYTSRGVGSTLLPVRFGARPEVAVLELTGAPRTRQG